MAHGQELFQSGPDLKLDDVFTRPWVPVSSELMRSQGEMPSDQRLSESGNQYCFVNLLWDSETIYPVNLLHAALTNSFCLDDIMILYRSNHG
jgi:hypothetical protein